MIVFTEVIILCFVPGNDSNQPFLVEEPEKLYKKAKMKMNSMFGSTSKVWLIMSVYQLSLTECEWVFLYQEGLIWVLDAIPHPEKLKKFNDKFELRLPIRKFNFPFNSKVGEFHTRKNTCIHLFRQYLRNIVSWPVKCVNFTSKSRKLIMLLWSSILTCCQT